MSRFTTVVESQLAQPAGLPSGVTFNGYWAAIVAGASANLKCRRIKIGVRAGTGPPTSQQVTIALYRQTVRPTGTGFSTLVPQALDPRSMPSQITGIDVTTAAAAGTAGPTLAAQKLDEWTFNTQQGLDLPWELIEELIGDQAAANGIAFVNIGNALPAGHLFTLSVTDEE